MSDNNETQYLFKAVLLIPIPTGDYKTQNLALHVANMDTQPHHLYRIEYRKEFKDGTVEDGACYFGTTLNPGDVTKSAISFSKKTAVIKLQTAFAQTEDNSSETGNKPVTKAYPIRGEIKRVGFLGGLKLVNN